MSVKEYYLKGEIDEKLSQKANLDLVYLKEQIDTLLAQKEEKGFSHSKDAVNAAIAKKADTVNTITEQKVLDLISACRKIAESYSKTDVDSLLADKAELANIYTKTETDDKFLDRTEAYVKTEVDELLLAKADKESVVTNDRFNTELAKKANVTDCYTKAQIEEKFSALPQPEGDSYKGTTYALPLKQNDKNIAFQFDDAVLKVDTLTGKLTLSDSFKNKIDLIERNNASINNAVSKSTAAEQKATENKELINSLTTKVTQLEETLRTLKEKVDRLHP